MNDLKCEHLATPIRRTSIVSRAIIINTSTDPTTPRPRLIDSTTGSIRSYGSGASSGGRRTSTKAGIRPALILSRLGSTSSSHTILIFANLSITKANNTLDRRLVNYDCDARHTDEVM